jgi:NAD(P)-dependent dehydrogenase (short-subunit alcohol dehydrogenase family)
MKRTVLVTEGDSPLGAALVRILRAKGWAVAAAVGTGPETPEEAPGPQFLAVRWNRRSPVSAHTLLLSALNAFGGLDEAFVLEAPVPPPVPLHKAASVDIEKAFDDAKGAVYAARELLSHFLERKSGVLCLISGLREAPAGGLDASLHEAFRGLASSLLAPQPDAGLVVNGFQSVGASPEEFAGFIDRTLDEKARKITGRWFTCPPKGGFFQGVLSGPSRKG